jgi:ABC-type Fe3+/spermidine/putrescine transport system ATPase subunit
MGIVFQNYALFQNMTVLGNVEYALKFDREFKGESRSRDIPYADMTGVYDQERKEKLLERWKY